MQLTKKLKKYISNKRPQLLVNAGELSERAELIHEVIETAAKYGVPINARTQEVFCRYIVGELTAAELKSEAGRPAHARML